MRWIESVVRIRSGWVTPSPPYLDGVHMAVVDHILKEVREVMVTLPDTKLKRRVLSFFQSSSVGGWNLA